MTTGGRDERRTGGLGGLAAAAAAAAALTSPVMMCSRWSASAAARHTGVAVKPTTTQFTADVSSSLSRCSARRQWTFLSRCGAGATRLCTSSISTILLLKGFLPSHRILNSGLRGCPLATYMRVCRTQATPTLSTAFTFVRCPFERAKALKLFGQGLTLFNELHALPARLGLLRVY
jgi:hypothetical protein